MTLRVGLPSDALGLKIKNPDGTWTTATGNTQIENLVTNPSFESVQPGSTVLRTNLITNPGAENQSITTSGNIGLHAGTRVAIAEAARSGSYGFRQTATADNVSPGFGMYAYDVPVGVYTASFYTRSSIATGFTAYLQGTSTRVTVSNSNGTSSNSLAPNVWTRHWFIINVTVAGSVQVGGLTNGGIFKTGDYIDYDDFLLEPGDQLRPYFDGSTPDALGWDYGWTGTANASTSTAKAASVEIRRNYISDPSFEAGNSGWGPNSGNITLSRDLTSAHTGSASIKGEVVTDMVGDINNFGARVPTVPGEIWTASAYVRTNATREMRLTVEFRDSAGQTITSGTAMATLVVEPSTSYVRMSKTYTAPAGASAVFMRVGVNSSAPAGFAWWFDSVLLEKSSTLGTYFNGSTASSGDFSYAWTGAADASASIQQAPAVAGYGVNYSGRTSWQSSEWPTSGKSITVLAGVPNTDTFATMPSPFPYGTSLAGRTFTFIGTIKTTETIPVLRDGRWWAFNWVVNKPSGAAHSVIIRNNATTAGTHEVRGTFTFPTDVTTSAFLRLYNGSSTPGNVVWWDNVVIVEGTYTENYFDGDTLPDVDYIYRWSGTPHASTSIGN